MKLRLRSALLNFECKSDYFLENAYESGRFFAPVLFSYSNYKGILSRSLEETLFMDLNSTEPPARKFREPKPKFNKTLPFFIITRSKISSLIPVKIPFKLSTDYPQRSARVEILSA
jgi:hypothetical protein